jgi:bifunctional DNA-binding transcriptional regulator/antitoxin component of YhaV-PrlF toxin-antitoxin module
VSEDFDKDNALVYQGTMAKVTSKLQVTVPKRIAVQYGIRPGDDIEWTPAGDAVRVSKTAARALPPTTNDRTRRLELFDLATQRQKARQSKQRHKPAPPRGRGWRRQDLYDRGDAR